MILFAFISIASKQTCEEIYFKTKKLINLIIINLECELEIDLKEMASHGYESIKEQIPKIKESLESGYEKLKEHAPKIQADIQNGIEKMKEQAPAVKENIEKGIEKGLESVREQAPKVKEYFKDATKSFFSFFRKLFAKDEDKIIVNK